MKSILKIPIYLIELTTSAKSFKDNPILGSTILNRCGLHVFRILLSHFVMHLRMLMLSGHISVADRRQFFQQGYLVKENFLSNEEFEYLEKEARSFTGEIREARQGDTLTHRAVLSPDVLSNYPQMKKVLFSQSFQRLARFTSGHLRDPLYYLEEVKNQYCEGGSDPQKIFHHDTFHPSMKCWLFIDDVAENSGAFTFIPESHKLTWKRIKWEYKMSLVAGKAKNHLHARGSTRYSDDDLTALNLPDAHAFTVKKNTLVLVNVFGIHKRGNSKGKSTRLALWGDSRTNPFLPFPGIGGDYANELQYYFLSLYRKQADESAAKRGVRSPWAVISKNKK